MIDPGDAIRDAIEALVGTEQTWIVGGEPPDYFEVLTDYTNQQIANGGGVASGPKGSERWKARRAFMRDLQRYRQGIRRPRAAMRERIEAAGLEARRREATPTTAADLVRLFRRHGLTVVYIAGVVIISDDESFREVEYVFCRPSALGAFLRRLERAVRRDDPDVWRLTFEELFEAWRTAYGVPGFALDELDALELATGRQPEHAGGRRVRAA